jgi:hypothetical protein
MTKYQKYTWVCTGDCDALIEYTFKDGYGWPAGEMNLTCRCGTQCTLLSVEDATIQPTETKGNQMETLTDNNYMTREFLESQLVQNKAYIAQLESAHANTVTRSTSYQAELNKMREDMKVFTLEGLDDDSLTEYQAEEIASICGFELTTEFELTVTVQYSVTVNARDEESAINAIHDTDFDTVSYDEPITYMSSSVDSVEVD